MNDTRNSLYALALAFAANAALAADTGYLPPPGLYQIDIAGGIKIQSPTHALERNDTYDGKSGSIESAFKHNGGSPAKNVIPGTGPLRTCIGPTKPGALPKGVAIDGCKATKGEVINGEMVAVHNCPWGNMKIHLRRLDAKTWQTALQRVQNGNAEAGTARNEQKTVMRLTRVGDCKS
ncbi:MAG: hypothetical protein AB1807_03060 [Pseudomonadota bacterium]|jgi:hypothetical protein